MGAGMDEGSASIQPFKKKEGFHLPNTPKSVEPFAFSVYKRIVKELVINCTK
jgi:hypothetical protein